MLMNPEFTVSLPGVVDVLADAWDEISINIGFMSGARVDTFTDASPDVGAAIMTALEFNPSSLEE